ncbi:MAG: antitoxin [Acidobacteria bacterium]|nr:antitoxin [Acidobacteriota bacterium]
MRTTVDVDGPILSELKRLQKQERKSLGRLVSNLLAEALAARKEAARTTRPSFRWISRPMGARVDLADKDAVHAALDRDAGVGPSGDSRS